MFGPPELFEQIIRVWGFFSVNYVDISEQRYFPVAYNFSSLALILDSYS
jgi:hypothetical protein